MGYIEGTSREQSTLWALEDLVDAENMTRANDRYVEVLKLVRLGFMRSA